MFCRLKFEFAEISAVDYLLRFYMNSQIKTHGSVSCSGVARLFTMPGQWVGKPFPMQHTYTCPSSYGHQYNIFKMHYVSSYTTVCKMTNINLIEANA